MARDLALAGWSGMPSTLIILPLIFKCRPLGCIYIFANFDVNSSLPRHSWTELTDLVSKALFLKHADDLSLQWHALLSAPPDEQRPMGSPLPSQPLSSSSGLLQPNSRPCSRPSSGDYATSLALKAPTFSNLELLLRPNMDSSASCWTSLPQPPSEMSMARENSAALSLAASEHNTEEGADGPSSLFRAGVSSSSLHGLRAWPELIELRADVHRTRQCSVYMAMCRTHRVAVKVLRMTTDCKTHEVEQHCKVGAGCGGGFRVRSGGNTCEVEGCGGGHITSLLLLIIAR